jgi:hypothetical protein
MPSISPIPNSREVDVGGDCTGGTERGASVGGAYVGDNDEGANTTGVSVGTEQPYSY